MVESHGKHDTFSNLADLPAYPVRLVFFRPDARSRIVATNVLFDIMTIQQIILDVLHILDLGVSQYAAAWVFTMLLLADCYDTGYSDRPHLLVYGIRAMNVRLSHGTGNIALLTRSTT